ncbi:MAG: hypothetical protein KGI08_10370 [Thaumarchaeota archaeon]|nr:hypothetical protein [Nitrososphaerota archaeon]
MPRHIQGWGKATDLLDLVQVTRRARMTWDEANIFLVENGFRMSRNKWFDTKRYLEQQISARIQYIAYHEYVDMHLQMIDSLKTDLQELERMNLSTTDKKEKAMLMNTKVKVIESLKQLYNSNTIVGGVDKLIQDLDAKAKKMGENQQVAPTAV